MKVYYLPNLDGQVSAIVAARTQTEACKLMGVSQREFRDYGGRRIAYGDGFDLALANPETVFVRNIMSAEKWRRAPEGGAKCLNAS